jgi:molybdenum cofactor biosynthesis enzyme MoaA
MKLRNLSERGVSPDIAATEAAPSADELHPDEALRRALDLAGEITERPRLQTTRERTITRRGVMWLGQTCNLRCYFCYFIDRIESASHPEHPFMTLEKAKKICKTLVDVWGNNAIDIQGGEPTIWPHILDLVRYCREIGLFPTLITNALVLDKPERCAAYKEAGIGDFLVSVHGIGEVHDRVVQLPGAHVRQMKALRNLREAGIPFRFNCVLSKPVVPQLPQIAELCVKTGARVLNFLTFNPFEDQARGGKRSANNVPMYSELSEQLDKALDILDDAGVEANVRYLPLCIVSERHRKSMYNFQQLPYDHHEWDYSSSEWTSLVPQRMKGGDVSPIVELQTVRLPKRIRKQIDWIFARPRLRTALFAVHNAYGRMMSSLRERNAIYRDNARVRAAHCSYTYASACNQCSGKNICDGFHGDYAELFGTSEARPFGGPKLNDPRHFIRKQDKIVQDDLPAAGAEASRPLPESIARAANA